MKRFKMRLTCCLCLCIILPSAQKCPAQAEIAVAPPLAVVTGYKGEVQVRIDTARSYETIYFGMHLKNGHVVRTGKSSTITILFANGSLISLNENSSFTISAGQVGKAPETGNALTRDMFQMITRITEEGLAGYAPLKGMGESLTLISPRNSVIRELLPRFEWTPVEGAVRYKITLYNISRKLWDMETFKPQLSLTRNQDALLYDESYFWQVEAVRERDSITSKRAFFQTVSADVARELEQQEKALMKTLENTPDESTKLFFRGAFFQDRELYATAIREYRELLELYPDSPIVKDVIMKLYRKVGLEELALR